MPGRFLVHLAFVLAVGAIAALPAAGRSAHRGGLRNRDQWLAYGGDDQLTNSADVTLTPGGLSRLWRVNLDGTVFGSPLYLDGVVFVATEAGSVYALDAVTGKVRWRDALGATETIADGCGTWGITSTPAIDLEQNALFAIGGDGQLHALALETGAELPSYPVTLIDRPSVEYVWGGLRILDGTLYVPVASYCDETGPPDETANGRVIAFDLATHAQTSLDTVPGPGNLGGVWGYGGVSSDGTYLYAGIGNAYSPGSPDGEATGYGDQVIQFTPAPNLAVVAANKPAQVSPSGDEDFGTAPLLLQPPGCPPLAIADNKSGYAFMWRRDHIADGPLTSFGLGDAVSSFVGAPSWSAKLGLVVFAEAKIPGEPPGAEGVAAFHVAADCRFVEAWRTPTGSGPQTAPLITGSLVFTGAGSGGIDALDARTGAIVWHDDTSDDASAPLIAGGGRVYAPAGDAIEAIGDE